MSESGVFAFIPIVLHGCCRSEHPHADPKYGRGNHGEKTKTLAPRGKNLRSQLWFDNPDNPGMTALYLERYLNYGLTGPELRSGKPIIGIAQTGSDLSPCNRHHLELAKRVREGIRDAGGIAFEFPVPSDPGDRQAADRGARPQPRVSRAWSRCCTAIRSTAWCC